MIGSPVLLRACMTVAVIGAFAPCAYGQVASLPTEPNAMMKTDDVALLPDAPSSVRFSTSAAAVESDVEGFPFFKQKTPPPVAPKYKSTILAGQAAVPLSARDKMIFGLRRTVMPGQLAGVLFSAGWAQVTDSRPHYGTDSAGFGQRLGASALRNTVQAVLNYGVLSSALHTDPRYYQLGDSKPIKRRVLYAATRVFVVRTDSGRPAPNLAYIGAISTASALTNVYYPERDKSVERTIAGIFTSMGGRAASLEWSEFGGDILRHVFRKH